MWIGSDFLHYFHDTNGRGSPDVLNSAVELLTGGPCQAWDPHVSERMSEARQDKNVRGSMSKVLCAKKFASQP
jgi:hypothetical protein